MNREEEIRNQAENCYGKTNPTFPLTEFPKEEQRQAFINGAKWADKTIIEKVVKWLNVNQKGVILTDMDIEQFQKAMEE